MEKRRGIKYITEFPASEPIVAMVNHKGKIVLATTKSIYEIKKDHVEKIKIKYEVEH